MRLLWDLVLIPFHIFDVKVRLWGKAERFKVHQPQKLHMEFVQGKIGEQELCRRLWLWQVKGFLEVHRAFKDWFVVWTMDLNHPVGLTQDTLRAVARYARKHPDIVRYWTKQRFSSSDEEHVWCHIDQLDRLIGRDLEKEIRRWRGSKNIVRTEN